MSDNLGISHCDFCGKTGDLRWKPIGPANVHKLICAVCYRGCLSEGRKKQTVYAQLPFSTPTIAVRK